MSLDFISHLMRIRKSKDIIMRNGLAVEPTRHTGWGNNFRRNSSRLRGARVGSGATASPLWLNPTL